VIDRKNGGGNEFVVAAIAAGLLAGCSASPNQQSSDQQAPIVQPAKAPAVVRANPAAAPAAPKINLDYQGFEVPLECPDVPSSFLDPRATWADPDAYDRQAAALAGMFAANFDAYAGMVTPGVLAAGPVSTPEAVASARRAATDGSVAG